MRRSKADEARESAAYAKHKGEAQAKATNAEGRVPRLRFPEYRQALAWVTNKLGTFVDEINDNNTDNENTVLTLSSENGLVIQEDYFNKRVASKDTCRYIPIKRNDFVYNDRSTTTSPFGTIKRLSKYDKGVVSPIYLAFRPRKAIDPAFLEYYFESGCHVPEMNQIVDQGARVGRFNLTPDKFFSINLYMPEKKEQQKIDACLSSLDDLITVHSRKLEALKKYKKGLMQQLFPAEGETVPRLRFPEFRDAGEWEEKTLDQLGIVLPGLTYSPDDTQSDGLLVLRSSNVRDGQIVLNDCVYVNPQKYTKATMLRVDDILICVRNGSTSLIGKNAMIPENIPSCTHGAFMTVCRATSPRFVFCLFQTDQYKDQVEAGLGARINSINSSDLLKYSFFVPSLREQEKIGDTFYSVDVLIAAQAAKVEELKEHKRGLMQGLFPAPEEE